MPLPADMPPVFQDQFRESCRRGTRFSVWLFACVLVIFLLLGIWPMALATLILIALAIWAWDLVPLLKPWQLLAYIVSTTAIYYLMALRYVGSNAEFHIYFLVFLTIDPLNHRHKLLAKALMTLGIIALFVIGDHWGRSLTPIQQIPANLLPYVRSFNFFGFCVYLSAIAYNDARAREHLSRSLLALASTDPLTGLLNRRRMEEFVMVIQKSHVRHRRTFTVIIGDVDHFKAINDRHGHETGDLVLKAVAQCLLSSVRAEDQVARWGGEEFLILLPESTLEAGIEAAERIRERVIHIGLGHEDAPILVTMTFGVAQADPFGGFAKALTQADAALYRGKETGRNRVEAAC